ncbi:hypothetical protein PYW07_006187 [Mythimna separata]|uniref:Cytochrome b5 heme-binding domain-containing protein n=1 Tax=Mythimna separata TaxID=271217 RepID=A0AAD7YU22_MYTSE|nr:hypothetical protein PYW07_006187 [Mythimna separata]
MGHHVPSCASTVPWPLEQYGFINYHQLTVAEATATRELFDLFGHEVATAAQTAGQIAGVASSTLARYAEDFEAFPDKSKQVQRNFTLAEVRRCDGQGGGCLYVVYDGQVLDLTEFAPYHLGGTHTLHKYAGQDATAAMLAAGMPAQVFDVFLKRFIVGRLLPRDRRAHIDSTMGDVKRYTLAEVSSRDGSKGQPLWTVYKDGVYDLTKYIDEHPGGYDTIMEDAGKDCTRNFDDVGHTTDALIILAKYKIGEIVEEEKRYDANGKKKKKVIPVKPDGKPQSRSCLGVITCGLLG